jgi:hypothetical protein
VIAAPPPGVDAEQSFCMTRAYESGRATSRNRGHSEHEAANARYYVRYSHLLSLLTTDWRQYGRQSGSQRAQSLSHVWRCQAIVVAGGGHVERREATSGGWVELTWEQEATGSNPAIPTAFFECIVSPV